jgi:hypothetical protein
MVAREARILLSLSRELVVKFAAHGSERLDPVRNATASTEARSLEGRPLAMYHSLTFADRSRLRLSEPWPRLAAAFDGQRRLARRQSTP